MFPNLYSMWKDAWERKILPPEWAFADDFLTWATQSGYKAEFGYEGAFTPENCLAAITNDISLITTGVDIASGTDKTAYVLPDNLTVEELVKKYKLAELKQLASDLKLDTGIADTKREIAEIIVLQGKKPPDASEDKYL